MNKRRNQEKEEYVANQASAQRKPQGGKLHYLLRLDSKETNQTESN